MKPFPWVEAMQFGFGVLRLSPDAFWRMTPRELAHGIAAVRGPIYIPLDRGGFDDLMKRFPDRMGGHDERDDGFQRDVGDVVDFVDEDEGSHQQR